MRSGHRSGRLGESAQDSGFYDNGTGQFTVQPTDLSTIDPTTGLTYTDEGKTPPGGAQAPAGGTATLPDLTVNSPFPGGLLLVLGALALVVLVNPRKGPRSQSWS